MKKKVFFGFVIAFIFIFIVIHVLSKDDNEVVLKTNIGASYSWQYSIEDTSIVKYANMNNKVLEKNVSDGKMEVHYAFKGAKRGETTITFNYKSNTGSYISKTKKYRAKVDKNLKLTLEEIKY